MEHFSVVILDRRWNVSKLLPVTKAVTNDTTESLRKFAKYQNGSVLYVGLLDELKSFVSLRLVGFIWEYQLRRSVEDKAGILSNRNENGNINNFSVWTVIWKCVSR